MKRNTMKLVATLTALFVLALSTSAFASGDATTASSAGGFFDLLRAMLSTVLSLAGEIG